MGFDLDAAIQAVKKQSAKKSGPARALILTHDNPDPDSLAAALGMKHLLEHEGFEGTIGLGGIIGRAENRAMVRELKIALSPIERLDLNDFAVVALVDTQPGTGNNSLPADRMADIVIDHHPVRFEANVPWKDVRPELGATATIVYGYLKERGLPIGVDLATAFTYALKSETRDLGREASPQERSAYIEVMAQADYQRLYAITSPKVGREHFVAVDRALRAAVSWGDLLTVNLGTLDFPDLVAEVADMMLPYDKCRWVLCVGEHEQVVYLSLRTDITDATAGALIRRVVGTKGAAGGHGMIAGGRLFAEVQSYGELNRIYDDLVTRIREELKNSAQPKPLL